MAVNIIMIKKSETEKNVTYYYGPNKETLGEINFNKENKTFEKLKPINSKDYAEDFFFNRAAQRLAKMWKDENFLDETYIQS